MQEDWQYVLRLQQGGLELRPQEEYLEDIRGNKKLDSELENKMEAW